MGISYFLIFKKLQKEGDESGRKDDHSNNQMGLPLEFVCSSSRLFV